MEVAAAETTVNPFTDLLINQGVVVNDGGMGTMLEKLGVTLDEELWSAGTVMTDPEVIKEVHRQYYAAGADVATAASYQGTIEGYMKKGCSLAEAQDLLRRAVKLACQAREEAQMQEEHDERITKDEPEKIMTGKKNKKRRLLVAASVGCYGAAQADGSEYRGDYGLTCDELVAWHRPRLAVLAQAGADILAFETVPCQVELRAILQLLKEDDTCHRMPCWVTFSCQDSTHLNSGDSLEACARMIEDADPILQDKDGYHQHHQVLALGINCTPPQYIEDAIYRLRKVLSPDRLVIVYPNSGEVWEQRTWKEGSGVANPEDFADLAEKWVCAGANIIGGCCRTSFDTIAAIRRRLVP